MNFTTVKEKALDFFSEASFISHIYNENEYAQALALMEELIEDYDQYHFLIDILATSIERWEDESPEFSAFNARIKKLNDSTATLKVLMDQYNLKAEDLKNEIGSKSLISMILNGTRKLTRDHIQALSSRFKINPSVFFH